MANAKPRLLTNSELRRYEDCAAENAKLANCWASDQVVILTIDCSSGFYAPGNTVKMPAMSVDMMTPAGKPICDSPKAAAASQTKASASGKQPPARHHSKRTIRLLDQPKPNQLFPPKPFHTNIDGVHEIFESFTSEAARDIFHKLDAAYTTMCIVTPSAQDTRKALDLFEVKLPSKAVFVDLIKVLEHQTRDEGIPTELSNSADQIIAVRNGRYERKAGPGPPPPSGAQLGLPAMQLLEVLGPAAERHRRDFRKVEKEDAAMKRIAGRIKKKGGR